MTAINLTPPQIQLTVGDLDVTNLVTAINLRQSAIQVRKPIFWQGTIDLVGGALWTGESLDDFANPNRWARGKEAISLTLDGTLFATLRIGSYFYDEETYKARMTVSQLINLVDYMTPPEDYRFISNSRRNTGLATAVAALLNGTDSLTLDLSDYVGDASFPAPDRSNKSYVALAQEILGERGYWLYHAPDETVKVKRLDLDAEKSWERTRGQVLEYTRQQKPGSVPTLYRVVGGGEKFQSQCSLASAVQSTEEFYGSVSSSSGYWFNGTFTKTSTTTSRRVIERITTTVTTDTASTITVVKESFKDLNLVDSIGKQHAIGLVKVRTVTNTRSYDYQGRLTKEVQKTDGIAYGNYPNTPYDLYPLALQNINDLEVVTTEYFSDPTAAGEYSGASGRFTRGDNNVIRLKIVATDRAYIQINRTIIGSFVSTHYSFYTAAKTKIVETWLEKCPGQDETTFIYKRKEFGRDPVYEYASTSASNVRTTELFLQKSSEKDNATPPGWVTRPPLYPRVRAKLSAEAKRVYPGSSDDFANNREQEYSANSITKEAEAAYLARILADLSMGRAFSYETALSLRESTEFVADPTPLQTAWVHNRKVLLDGASLVIVADEAEIAWEAVALKTLTPSVGEGSPIESDFAQPNTIFSLITDIQLGFTSQVFNASELPDVALITVDANGDVTTVSGFVQASSNQGQFGQILVSEAGEVVVSAGAGNVVTTVLDIYDESVWNAIATIDGDIVTIDGEVVVF